MPKTKDGKQKTHAITIRISDELYEQLIDHCDRTGQFKTTALERALEYYMAKCKKQGRI